MMLDNQLLLLALDLGLGKTVCSIAAIEELIDSGEAESVLIICPASIKWQWKRQIDKFTDGALVKVIEGSKGERMAQYRAVRRGDVEYVIMNYEQIVADFDWVKHFEFDVIVCDEVVAIKSPAAKRSKCVKRMQAPYRFGLSGQPIENRPEELFNIMQWVDPDVLGHWKYFEAHYIVRNSWGSPKSYKNLKTLRDSMSESMFRRTRKDVADQMPDVVEIDYTVDFDPAAEKLYRSIVDELLEVIRSVPKFNSFNLMNHYAGVDDKGPMGEIMPRLMALRMLCNHPGLMRYSADQFDDPESAAGSRYLSDLRSSGAIDSLKKSPKMDVAFEVIDEILEADPKNKVVLFSFFKPMLALISSRLKVDHEIFTGDLTPRERDAALERFTNDEGCRVFLSSDAGGIGVDIPVANFLISFDLPWSAGKFEQRNGRIVRISSKWPEVTLITLAIKDSIEERMIEMLQAKSAVAAAWLDGEGIDEQDGFTVTLGGLAEFLEDHQ